MSASFRSSPWLFVCVVCVAGTACRKEARQKQNPLVLATVNGESISRSDFEQDLSRELQMADGSPTPEQVEPVKRALLDTLIERTLLLQAARLNNVTVTPEEVDRGVLRISSDYPAEGFNEALSQGQMSMADLKQKTANVLVVEKLFQQHVFPRLAVTEDEIRAFYEAHEDDYQEPERVHAAQIVVKGLDDAKRIQAQLKSGKKFADLARKYSLSADAKVGGDLGFFSRGVMPPQFDEVAFKLGVNQISEVVTSEYGYHLFRVIEKRPARQRTLVEVRAQVEAKLIKNKKEQAQHDFVKGLRDKAEIAINEAALQTVTAKASAAPARVAEP